MHLWTPLDTPLGRLTLVGSARGLSQVYFPDEAPNLNGLQRLTDRSDSAWSSVKVLVAATQQITEYFAGTRRDFELLLDVPASPDTFRARAQRALRDIRFGERWTYSRLASAAGSAQAARAAGSACASNPLPLVVPCHRVVPASGGLGSYRGGVAAKRLLLKHEAGNQ
ncbi:cysteine methyltransferase [Corynebacterium sp. HMSC072D12]|uniref:methylated-DNA--[protein]-cysteine S-methyltransferase n=1 Tax=Corynebacterium sp. HMSC072D12 TaxID=1739447 RepID=UPI0008A2F234|nr:methylated-DNA--[protein]-cysteine S-methyltransferase [Corynebacterium sp. HMSC072D12]OFQ34255.1 cysteine methyltransferase [Corynebacterium sp. HMSC072D12]